MHFATDRICLETVAPTCGKIDLSKVTFGWIRNSLELSRLGISENLREEIEKDPLCEIESIVDFEFDDAGNLVSPFMPVGEAAGMH
jgi:hypothetical protein